MLLKNRIRFNSSDLCNAAAAADATAIVKGNFENDA